MSRKKLSMDRDWHFCLGEQSVVNGTDHGEIYNYAKAGACKGPARPDFDVTDWEKVDLPHDWSIRQAFDKEGVADWGYKPRGKAWYRKAFILPESYENHTLILEFEGIATQATVYFNGSVLYRNYSGYTPFTVDITDMAYFGEVPNVLAVFVDASIWEGWWYEGAGIYRSTWLHVLPETHFVQEGLFVHPVEQEEGAWRVDVTCEIEGKAENNGLEIEAFMKPRQSGSSCLKKRITLSQGEITRVQDSFIVENPSLWDIDEPNLYVLELELTENGKIIDRMETTFGFRTVTVDAEKGFFLNHRRVKILGTCNHQDFGGIGVAVPDNLWEYKIEKLKEMGSNAYRCAHGMPADGFLDACDCLGMLVMNENRNFSTSVEGMGQLDTLLRRQRNHPSVVMYSIFNEEPLEGTSQGMRMAGRMADRIHQLAPGSLITGAMHGGLLTEKNAALQVDVCGINYQREVYDEFHKLHPEIPIVGSETTSTFAVRGCYHTDAAKNEISCYDEDASDWGNTVRETWKAIMERDYVMGGFMWTGFDYLGEPTPHVWPSVSSFFGMMDICGFPKDGFYLAKAIFSKEPVCHVLPHWNHPGREGQRIRVMSHTNCQEAELLVNEKCMGKKPVSLYEQAYWDVAYEPGKIELVGYCQGRRVASCVRETAGEVREIEVQAWRECLPGDGRAAMPVALIARDEQGREVPIAEDLMKISVEGGVLLGTCNGNPNCHEEFTSAERSLFHGRAMAVVRPDRKADGVRITATLQGSSGETITGSTGFHVLSRKEEELICGVEERYLTHWKISSKVYDTRPDVLMKTEDFDMNSWEDIRVDDKSGCPVKFENCQGKYILYRMKTQIPAEINGHLPTLYFHSIWGNCEFYINGEKRGECSHLWSYEHELKLEEKDKGETEIRILVESLNVNGGLASLVVLR